jgi:hypothetical protein
MRIDPKPSASLGGAAPSRRPGGARGFTLAGDGAAVKSAPVRAATPLATVDALIALQGEGDPSERRRRSVRRGHDLLDALDRVKCALLANRIATADLQQVAAKLAERRDLTDDPRLDDLLAHIELRAKVELAKLGL